MDVASLAWLSELAMEDPTFIQQYEMGSLDQFSGGGFGAAFRDDFSHSLSPEINSYPSLTQSSTTFSCSSMEASPTRVEPPTKVQKTASTMKNSSSPSILSFGNYQSSPETDDCFYGNASVGELKRKSEMISGSDSSSLSDILISQGHISRAGQGPKRVNTFTKKLPSQAQDHILAERRRREKLSQRFIALSAIVPGLKKTDKASILEDAIKYLKELKEKVNALEDQGSKKPMESVVYLKKTRMQVDDQSSFSSENFDGHPDGSLPEIEARVSGREALIKIQCERRRGAMVKALAEIERIHLSITGTNAVPFAHSSLDITLTAQMEEGFDMTAKDIVKTLHSALSKF